MEKEFISAHSFEVQSWWEIKATGSQSSWALTVMKQGAACVLVFTSLSSSYTVHSSLLKEQSQPQLKGVISHELAQQV